MELWEEITKVLNEELGIADSVKETTNEIVNIIAKDSEKQKEKTFNNFIYKTGQISNLNISGINIDLLYTVYILAKFSDIENLSSIILYPGSFSPEKHLLKTSIVYIKRSNRYIDYIGTTQHELEHAYQYSKTGKSPLSKQQSFDIYKKAENLILNEKNIYELLVGCTIYYNSKFEKNALINDTYRLILDTPEFKPIEIIKNTNLYININYINKYSTNYSLSDKQSIENVVNKTFGKHFNWWLNMAKKVVKEYKISMGKVLLKAQKDLQENNTFIHFNKKIEESTTL